MSTKKESRMVGLDAKKEAGLHPIEGKYYSFITVAPLFHGELVAETDDEFHLKNASWVPETGRVHEFAEKPEIAVEVEFIGDLVVPKAAVVGYFPSGKEPLKTK